VSKIIVVDKDRCLGCKSCVIECAMAHTEAGTLVEALESETPPQPRLYVEAVAGIAMPVQCQHCEDAPCLAACPTGAIHRTSDDGPVLLDPERCIGCKFCLLVCPFGVIDLSRDGGVMVKCDLCIERTENGKAPACVAGCPTKAIQFVELDDYLRRQRRQAARRAAEVPVGAQDDD